MRLLRWNVKMVQRFLHLNLHSLMDKVRYVKIVNNFYWNIGLYTYATVLPKHLHKN